MEYRQLGRSGLRVSVLTMGTMTFGSEGGKLKATGNVDRDGARRQVDMCLDAGINLFDTSNAYTAGVSEEILGEAAQGRRDDLLLATKVRFPMGKGPNAAGLSRHHIIAQCEASLRRLRTDYIDLYQMHEWDGLTPIEETMEALDTLLRSGKVRYIGASNFSGWHLMKAQWAADRNGYSPLVSQQIHYSLVAREAENELVPISIDQGLGILVWSPLAGGLLTGKYRRDQPSPENTRRVEGWSEPPIHDEVKLFDIVEVLIAIGQERDVPPAHVALAWLLAKPGVASVVFGARNDEQLKANLRAAELTLTPDEVARLDEVSALPLLYPYWHQANTATDRLSPADLTLLGRHMNKS